MCEIMEEVKEGGKVRMQTLMDESGDGGSDGGTGDAAGGGEGVEAAEPHAREREDGRGGADAHGAREVRGGRDADVAVGAVLRVGVLPRERAACPGRERLAEDETRHVQPAAALVRAHHVRHARLQRLLAHVQAVWEAELCVWVRTWVRKCA